MKLVPRPDGLCWVEIAGTTAFPCYAMSGGLCARPIAYLVKTGDGLNPYSDGRDLGMVKSGEEFTVFQDERGWKHAVLWLDFDTDNIILACAAALNA